MDMVVIVPRQAEGIHEIIGNLDTLNEDSFSKPSYLTVDLFMPKFKIESSLDMKESLRKVIQFN